LHFAVTNNAAIHDLGKLIDSHLHVQLGYSQYRPR
jgi:hypothetical protein